VGQIQEVSDTIDTKHGEVTNQPTNVFRDDVVTNKGGEYTDKILKQAPATENGFLKVKQIL
jgi:Asp-tRNA(Asn)/Glu-tRNA(Gln) amidotransferase C subunit